MYQEIEIGVAALKKGGFDAWYATQVNIFESRRQTFSYVEFVGRTQRAKLPLNCEQDLINYSALYAGDHFARFTELLARYKISTNRPELHTKSINIKVFDYGCGQGLASLALMQYLAGRQLNIELHLIEPSELALQAALAYTHAQAYHYNFKLQVYVHCCGLDQLPTTLFTLQPQQSAIHLFSNVLDLTSAGYFNLPVLLNQWQEIQGMHLCLAVSPNYLSGKLGFDLVKKAFMQAHYLVDTESLIVRSHNFRLGQGILSRDIFGRALAAKFQTGIND